MRTAHQFALESPQVVADMVEANEFPELSQRFGVMSVPHTVVNDGKVDFVGALPERAFLQKVLEALTNGQKP